MISVSGGHCDCSHRTAENVPVPFYVHMSLLTTSRAVKMYSSGVTEKMRVDYMLRVLFSFSCAMCCKWKWQEFTS